MDYGFSALWRRNPQLAGQEKHELTSECLKRFDQVYDEWLNVRGFGRPGSIAGYHRYNPEWENTLVEMGMGSYDPDRLLASCCYRTECPITCPNNRQAEKKLHSVMTKYMTLPNNWENWFLERREEVISQIYNLYKIPINLKTNLNQINFTLN